MEVALNILSSVLVWGPEMIVTAYDREQPPLARILAGLGGTLWVAMIVSIPFVMYYAFRSI